MAGLPTHVKRASEGRSDTGLSPGLQSARRSCYLSGASCSRGLGWRCCRVPRIAPLLRGLGWKAEYHKLDTQSSVQAASGVARRHPRWSSSSLSLGRSMLRLLRRRRSRQKSDRFLHCRRRFLRCQWKNERCSQARDAGYQSRASGDGW